MEPLPFGKRFVRTLLMLLRIPTQHRRIILQAHGATVGGHDPRWIVEQIIRIHDANINLAILSATISAAIGGTIGFGPMVAAACDAGPNLPYGTQEVEEAAQLRIAGLGGHVVVESRDAIKRWDGAAEVRRDTGARVADQKGKVELAEHFLWNDGRVVGFDERIGAVGGGGDISVADDGGCRGFRPRVVGTYAALDPRQRGGDGCWFFIRRDDVVSNVLDEETFALDSG